MRYTFLASITALCAGVVDAQGAGSSATLAKGIVGCLILYSFLHCRYAQQHELRSTENPLRLRYLHEPGLLRALRSASLIPPHQSEDLRCNVGHLAQPSVSPPFSSRYIFHRPGIPKYERATMTGTALFLEKKKKEPAHQHTFPRPGHTVPPPHLLPPSPPSPSPNPLPPPPTKIPASEEGRVEC